ncbi:MAG: TonB-dependent receptor [Ignavibacteria bacterium]|nr:TonB-dependent receptor [Ignavibacteria bacterium]
MRKLILFSTILFLFSIQFLFSQFQITGFIFDALDNKKLSGAKIYLEGTLLGAISDKDGFYRIAKIPTGEYSLIVQLIGYDIFKKKIIITKDTTINFGLKIKEITKPEVVVSASRRVQSFFDVPVSMSIIENEYLKNKNYIEVKEYLKFLPAVEVNSDNISIRGSSGFQFGSGSRVSLLLDGFPFLSGDIGEANLNLVSPKVISQIEILKGSGSAIFGNSAMGGVVNIITKEPEGDFSLSTDIVSGIYTQPKYSEWIYTDNIRTRNNIAVTSKINNRIGKFLLNAQFTNDESYRKFNKSNTIVFFGKYSKPFNNGKKVNLLTFANYKYSDDATFWSGTYKATSPPEDYDLSRRVERNRFAIGVEYVSPIGTFSYFSLKTSIFRTHFESNLPKDNINYRQSTSYSNFNEFQINHHLFTNSIITSGVTIINNWVNSFQYGNRKQSILSAFTQGEFSLTKLLDATGGIRFDYDVSEMSKKYFEVSPRFGISLDINDKMQIRTSLGKGFRVATISERFSSIRHSGFTIEPNPNLAPEKSWNFEFGTKIETSILNKIIFLDASLFLARFKNLIEPQFDTNATSPTIRFQNISNAEIKGIDFSLRTKPFSILEAHFNFTLLDPIDLDRKQILKFRAKYYLTSGLQLTYDEFQISLLYKYISKIINVEEQLRFVLKDYDVRVPVHLLDLNINYNLQRMNLPMNLTFSVHNILDYYYIDLVGNLAPTRLISIGISYNFF